jgi:type VI secretion system secreted protein VgrG
VKVDAGGVTISGAEVKINTGGASGVGSGIGILPPNLPFGVPISPVPKIPSTALINFKQASVAGAQVIPVCGKQSNGICTREDCTCI